jgi:hypothetical protein
MAIHRRVHRHDRPLHDGAILELNGDLLAVELLEELDKLHDSSVVVVCSR